MTKGSHKGPTSRFAYDFALPMNTPVLAAAPGVVSFTRTGNTICGGEKKTRFANVVTINHADGSATQYGHLTTVGVEVGQVVEAGQEIGRSGKTGNTSCDPHLHFARQYQGELVARSIPVYFKGYEHKRLLRRGRRPGDRTVRRAARGAGRPRRGHGRVLRLLLRGRVRGSGAVLAIADDRADLSGRTQEWAGRLLARCAPARTSTRWTGRFEFAPWWYTFRVEATRRHPGQGRRGRPRRRLGRRRRTPGSSRSRAAHARRHPRRRGRALHDARLPTSSRSTGAHS